MGKTVAGRPGPAELAGRARDALEGLRSCALCPRCCGIDRVSGRTGFCRGGALARVASHNDHRGEEPPISGTRGSGTIFFSGCTMGCLFCQNYPISQRDEGNTVSSRELARMLLYLQKKGCHNINLVTGTHFVPQFIEAFRLACLEGFKLPIVYNTSGYESPGTLKLLEGIVSVYLPDLKYADDEAGREISGVDDYFTHASAAILEMHRQVGELKVDGNGIATGGLLVRHLVLPEDLSTTCRVLDFLAREISPGVHLSLMSQYFPAHQATGHRTIGRKISAREYRRAVNHALALGMENVFIQEMPGR